MDKTFKPTHFPTMYLDDEKVQIQRACFMHRSTWLYLLVDEMRKAGIDYEAAAREAVRRCGALDAHGRYDADSMEEFSKRLMDESTKKTMEAEVTVGENEMDIEFHYCPHMTAWQKLTDDPELFDKLCDIAMEGDREIFRQHPNWNYELTDRIGAGCKSCKMHITRKK